VFKHKRFSILPRGFSVHYEHKDMLRTVVLLTARVTDCSGIFWSDDRPFILCRCMQVVVT